MPQATNLTIKNAANEDKIFTLLTPASGDGSVARWALKEGTVSSVFPTITISAATTSRDSRSAHVKIHVPSFFMDGFTGKVSVDVGAEVNVKVAMPNSFPEANKPDFVAYVINALQTALVKEVIKDALPAT